MCGPETEHGNSQTGHLAPHLKIWLIHSSYSNHQSQSKMYISSPGRSMIVSSFLEQETAGKVTQVVVTRQSATLPLFLSFHTLHKYSIGSIAIL